MKKEFTIRHIDDLKKIGFFVENQLKNEEKLTVIVKPFAPDITAAQRGLYWQWITDIGNELGDSKEYYHEFFKLKFLVNIFRKNPDKVWYREMVEAFLAVRQYQTPEQIEDVRCGLVKLTSITDAEKGEMSEYMDNIKHFAAMEMRIALRLPDDGLI